MSYESKFKRNFNMVSIEAEDQENENVLIIQDYDPTA
jgi:hypothetical protein